METLRITLSVSILLCGLVAGLVFTFAIIVMPGAKSLNDHDFLQAFKAMDRIIQNNHPLFIVVWLGSVLAVLAVFGLGLWQLQGIDRALIVLAAAMYLLGVQLPTVTVNVPLNNQLQQQDLDSMTDKALQEAREAFEPRWIKWNTLRTILAVIALLMLIFVAIRL